MIFCSRKARLEGTGMKISVILAHPVAGSFNHAIALKAVKALKQNGHDAFFHDLLPGTVRPPPDGAEFARQAPLPPEIHRHLPGDRRGRRDRHRPPELVGPAAGNIEGWLTGHPARCCL